MEKRLMGYDTPLRYPGGKAKLANYIKMLLKSNNLLDIHYAEPYAGGAGVAFSLLFGEYASHIHINDLDPAIYYFWYSILNHTEELCNKIENVDINMHEWHRQKLIQENQEGYSPLEIGFSTFFLNRTNRSGIITGGVIGGKNQTGEWKLDARFNRKELTERIRRIAQYKNRISIYNKDASNLLTEEFKELGRQSLVYLDPPYYVKGQDLYKNYYNHEDHVEIASLVEKLDNPWIVSYDNASQIRDLYKTHKHLEYSLSYSASERYQGTEVMFFSKGLILPRIKTPTDATLKMSNRYQPELPFSD